MPKVLLILLFMSLAAVCHSQKIRIVGNSPLAKIAGKIKGEKLYAVTFRKTIFLSCKKKEFFDRDWWMKHELTHVEQYKKYGTMRFLTLYLYYSVFHRQSENPFEKEAEAAENSSEETVAMWSPM